MSLRRLVVGLVSSTIALFLTAPTAGAFGGYETADLANPGEVVARVGLGGQLGPGLIVAYRPQVHVRVGIAPRLDVGLGTGVWVERNLASVSWLGVTGDLRYQLNRTPDLALGYTPPTIPFGGTSMGTIGLYASQSFGTLTPYGRYRLGFRLANGLALSHDAAVGVELDNPGRLPTILALGWQDGTWVLGLAFRF
ncbi:MAG: hypothetical protein ABEK03_08280 [Candidatus Bipolaricaulia bacterium]